jgi:hypothetical protein
MEAAAAADIGAKIHSHIGARVGAKIFNNTFPLVGAKIFNNTFPLVGAKIFFRSRAQGRQISESDYSGRRRTSK